MTLPKIYVRATHGAAKDGDANGHFALGMKPLRRALALLFVCFGMILLARCGGGSGGITVQIQPSLAPTVDESQSPCNAPNNLLGCQMLTFTAAVTGDKSNAGVTWNLTKLSTGCSGTGCGTLINASPASVTYVAPSNIGAELNGVMLQAVSITNPNATTSLTINIVLDPTFTLIGLQQCAVGIYCLPDGSNGIAYNSQNSLLVSNGVAPFTFIVPPTSPAPVQINSGGPAVPPFIADNVGGTTISTANAIDTSKVTNPAPMAVYQTARTGNFIYTIAGFPPGSIHLLRLHFAEIQLNMAGQRIFNVSVNGTQVLTSFDIFAAAGGENIAIVEQGTLPANSNGQFVIQFTGVTGAALLSGLEVEPNSCPPANLNVGTLPPGLTLNPGTGTIVGRPTSPTAGNPAIPFQFTVQATDDSATPVSVCQNFQITIQPPPTLSITTSSLPPGTVDAAYSASISTNGGVNPLTWTILNTVANPDSCNNVNGLLPPGLVLNPASGQISGIPKGPPIPSCSFTVQVEDSSLPGGQIVLQTLSLTIKAPPPLQITSSPTLPGGFVATTYSPLPLIATGGVAPYTWTVTTGQLPAGLVLAPDGTVSGTPVLATTPPTDDFFVVQVSDSELDPVTGLPAPMTASQTFDITISVGTGKPNTLFSGVYAFLFNGFDKSGPVTIIGTVSPDGRGNISGGEEDIYRDGTAVAQALVLGVYSIGTNGRGTMELAATDPVSHAAVTTDYRVVLESGGGTGPSNVRFFEDNSTATNNDAPNATHGSGVMKPEVGSNFAAPNFSGNYAFEFTGYESAGVLPTALAGVVQANGSAVQPTLTGRCDFNDAGAYSSQPLSGSFSPNVDAGGRGTGELDFAQPGKSQLSLHFVFYFVSPNDIYFMENDTSASEPKGAVFYQLSGEMLLQQPGYQFTNAAFLASAGPPATSGVSVATGTGLNTSKSSVFAGLLSGAAGGVANFTYDENNGGVPASLAFSGTYSVANNGRTAFTGLGATAATTRIAAAYLTGPAQGFLIGSDTAVTTGLLELQSGVAPFTAASLEGGYTLSASVPADNQVTNVIGQVNSNGGGTLTGNQTVDEYDPPSVAHPEGFLNLGQMLSSAYSVSASGRATLGPVSVIGFPNDLILYIVSPGNFRGVSSNATVNGHPAVYFFNH